MKGKLTARLLLTMAAAAAVAAAAQSGPSTTGGVYTDAQAQQGHALYTRQCAMCHGASLQGMGGQFPALTGPDFLKNWTGQTLGDLYTQIHATMPATLPGSLKPEEVARLMAYILSVNHYPAGKRALPQTADKLRAIRIDPPPAGTN